MRAPPATAIVSIAVALAPGLARAQAACQPADGLSTCLVADNVWVAEGAGRWQTLAPVTGPRTGGVHAGLVVSYLHRPIGLLVASPDPEGTVIYAVDNLISATAVASYGITDRVRLGVAVPAVVFQDGATKSDIVGSDEQLPSTALGDLRFGAAVAMVPRQERANGAELGGAFELSLPTGDPAAFASAASATYAPSLGFRYRLGDLLVGAQGGARIRAHTRLATTQIGPQLSAAVGASYDLLGDGWLSAGAELQALFTLVEQRNTAGESDPPHIPIEWAVSLRTGSFDGGRLALRVAGGGAIPSAAVSAVTTPAFRITSGVAYRFE